MEVIPENKASTFGFLWVLNTIFILVLTYFRPAINDFVGY